METPVVKSRGRPRKRRREDELNEGNLGAQEVVNDQNVGGGNGVGSSGDVQVTGNGRKRGRPPKKRAVEMKGEAMVGRYVLKEFDGNGVFLGKIVSYDSGLYRVDYEDGDCEDLDSEELREFVIADERQKFVGEFLERKTKLDEAIEKKRGMESKDMPEKSVKLKTKLKKGGQSKEEPEKGLKLKNEAEKTTAIELVFALEKVDMSKSKGRVDEGNAGNVPNDVRMVEVPALSDFASEDVSGSDIDDNDDGYKDGDDCFEDDDESSSSDSFEYGQGWDIRAETEIPAIPPLELPPSSGTIGVPEEYVSHLFSVHVFLRTFSVRLFLSPFTLDDLVGCVKCTVSNTLLDAIHVALLRALRQHLEGLASEGSQLASKCLRSIDWGLLDSLTWPVYLVHYLMAMGHLNGDEWKGFFVDVLEKNYCTLPIGTKLMVLQILCDDALDTEDIRAEIDKREASEVGIDSDGVSSNLFDSLPRKVYPRNAKTSVDKERINANLVIDTDDVGEDGNVDECRLCGMEGMLICCDGCPSAYHSRCIGVNKLSIPEGEWFCPECTISRIGPPITMGTSLRGAEVFGVDSYGQLFLGTCNHLLVLKVSVKASSFLRYYNRNDIPKVVLLLSSSPYHAVSYLGICHAISKYWELPQVILSPLLVNQSSTVLQNLDENRLLPLESHPSDENVNQKVLYKVENEADASRIGERSTSDASGLGNEKFLLKSGSDDLSVGASVQYDSSSMPYMSVAGAKQNATNMTVRFSEQAELSRTTQEGLAGQSSMTGLTSWMSGYNSSSVAGYNNGACLPEPHIVQVKEDRTKANGRASQKKKDTCVYMGSIFKPFAYINHYVHGAFAASAAANFAGLSSDENRASEVHASDARKAMAANVALQVKAFASAAVRFFWPSTEKKLIEIPRERCSWCLHCTAPIISRKACLLNQAALNATRGEMKFVSGLRSIKLVEGSLYGIAAYTIYMEESFRGLILGPFRSSIYREQWRKKVELASTCREMKFILLDLERNLSTTALSSEWIKFVDNWMYESSVPQIAAASGSIQKRGAGKRKKQLAVPEVTADDSNDSNELCWWRGGKLAKHVFQRGTFPRRVLRKAVLQGGCERLPGICYADGSDVPKRSRQFIWRAAVEMANNASQLALQVRYLDQYMKWSDLVRPEQNPVDGKGPETEAYAFRTAQICDKKIIEDKIMYGVSFGHQKHLSSRLMKSIVEKEEGQDGKDKYWLLEARTPLYLIKEYEEKADITTALPPRVEPDRYSKHQRRQLKASRKEIFVYLALKKDGLHVCPCASCRGDVLIDHSGTCNSCEGYCHKICMLSSTEVTNEAIESRVTCKRCSHGKLLSLPNNSVESPTSPLVMQGQEFQISAAVARSGKLKPSGQQQQNSTGGKSLKPKIGSQHLPSGGTLDGHSDKKPKPASLLSNSSKSKRASLHWGLVWKKKESDDGSDFRRRNIIFRGYTDGLELSPNCFLCNKSYSPHLMYIRCEACENWFHADAVTLDESKLPELIGFKCCRCRRIRIPVCPYADPDPKKTEVKRLRVKGPKQETMEANSVSEAISEQAESLPSTPISLMEMEGDVLIEVDDPFLSSVSQVEQLPELKSEVDCEWNAFGPGPQKLPVRRHLKNENDDDWPTCSNPSYVQLPTSVETGEFSNSNVEWDMGNGGLEVGHSNVEWDMDNGGLEVGTTSNLDSVNYEGDYEPQTYFSFRELLEGDGANQLGVGDSSNQLGVGDSANQLGVGDSTNQLGGVDGADQLGVGNGANQLGGADDANQLGVGNGANQLGGADGVYPLEGAAASREAWENMPCEYSQNGFMEQGEISSFDELKPQAEPGVDILCEVCHEQVPAPDLACNTCGIWIHSTCSPWEDEGEVIQRDNWTCGLCSAWR